MFSTRGENIKVLELEIWLSPGGTQSPVLEKDGH